VVLLQLQPVGKVPFLGLLLRLSVIVKEVDRYTVKGTIPKQIITCWSFHLTDR
jgi:hypothetical protein